MDIKPIRTEQDYQDTLTTISILMTAAYGTHEGDRLDIDPRHMNFRFPW